MEYLTWVGSGSSGDRFPEFIGIYLSLSVSGGRLLARTTLHRGWPSLFLPEYARIAFAATAPSIFSPLFHCMFSLLSCYRLLVLYSVTVNIITVGSPKPAFICFMRLKDCIFAHEGTGAMRRNSGAERHQASGTAAMTLK